jgi:adenylate cyclase
MHAALAALNGKWVAEGRPEIAIGIGLNTGQMAVGNMGSAARFDYTVLGDQVNLASRLEGLTKEYRVGILVGEATMRAAGDRFVFREIDVVRVKGRVGSAPVSRWPRVATSHVPGARRVSHARLRPPSRASTPLCSRWPALRLRRDLRHPEEG